MLRTRGTFLSQPLCRSFAILKGKALLITAPTRAFRFTHGDRVGLSKCCSTSRSKRFGCAPSPCAVSVCTARCFTSFSSSSPPSNSGGGTGYKYFEDMYTKQHVAPPRYACYEDQMEAATVKCFQPKRQLSESEKLQHLHDWKKDKDGYSPPPEFGWAEEWGPEPGEEGHKEWYKKNRMYMSYEEKSKYDIRAGVPVEKNSMRHQEMPYHKRMKAGYVNLENKVEQPQYFDMRSRKYWANYSYEDQRDTMAKAKDDFLKEWLEKPNVTRENVGKEIAEYNGTGKQQKIQCVKRRPEWELAPAANPQK